MINEIVRWRLEQAGPNSFLVTDFDRRRTISVTVCGECDDRDTFIESLGKHIDSLGPKVHKIEVSTEGEFLDAVLDSVSSKESDDETLCVHYPPLQELKRPARVGIIARAELEELRRLVPNVDLVSYDADTSAYNGGKRESREVVFKYYFHKEYLHERWDELNLWMRLPPHPNIVPFDRLVVEELHGRQVVVGFTNLYIRGGTLNMTSNKPHRPIFKLKWLLQLTKLVDDLNLRFGIEHQDIAPRNLIVDEATDNIMLFDFNCSSRIGGPLRNGKTVYNYEQNDVKGVVFTLYEILTQDYSLRYTFGTGQRKSSARRVLELKDWIKDPEMQLDHSLNDYRAALEKWLETRKEREPVVFYTDAPEYIDWPPMREPPCSPCENPKTPVLGGPSKPEGHWGGRHADKVAHVTTCNAQPRWEFKRRDERKSNRQVIEWERPATTKMTEGISLFADGKIVEAPDGPSRWTPGYSPLPNFVRPAHSMWTTPAAWHTLMDYRRKYSDYLLLLALALIHWAIIVLVTNKRTTESDETDFDLYMYDGEIFSFD